MAGQVRIRQWAEQIRDCQNRPEGMDVETWCSQNHITKSNYYYRLRRVRKACQDQIPETEVATFVELPALDTAASKNTFSLNSIPMTKIPCFYSAEEDLTGLLAVSGKR